MHIKSVLIVKTEVSRKLAGVVKINGHVLFDTYLRCHFGPALTALRAPNALHISIYGSSGLHILLTRSFV